MSIASRITEMEQHIGNAYDKIEDLGIDLTDVDKNINNISSMLEDVWEEYPKVTATNVEEATLNGTKKGRMNIDPKGQTEQATTILPTEYQQVEYIESTGTQYIYTGLTSDKTKKLRYEASIMWSNDIQTRQNCGADYGQFFGIRNGIYQIGVNNTTIVPSTTTFDKVIAEYDMPNNSGFLNVNGTVFNFTRDSWTNADISIFILKAAGGNLVYPMSCKIKYFKIYEDNTLIANYIPCYRKSDSVIGLYNTVSNTFKTNDGTGTFNKGNDVTVPNPDFPIPIHNVSGNNNIKIQNKNLVNTLTTTQGQPSDTSVSTDTLRVFPENTYIKGLTYNNYYKESTITITSHIGDEWKFSSSLMGYGIGFLVKFKNNGNHIFSGNINNGVARLAKYDNQGNFITYSSLNEVIDIDVNYKYVLVISPSAVNTTCTFSEIQLEQGSTATTYVVHQEQNLPFIFAEGQKAMQGTTLQDDGIHQARKQVVLDGNTSIKINAQTSSYISFYIDTYRQLMDTSKNILCNMLTKSESKTPNTIRIDNSNDIILYFDTNFCDYSSSAIKNKLQEFYDNGNPMMIEIPLAEEEIISYSETQQSQYNAIKQAMSSDGQTNISQTNDDLPFKLDITALKNS